MTRLRGLPFRGAVLQSGVVIDRDALGEDEARRRVVALWNESTVVRPSQLGYVVSSAVPVRVRADEALGLVLVARDTPSGTILAGLPLADDEIAAMSLPRGTVVVVRGGEAVVADATSPAVEPSQWIDLDAWSLAPVEPLAEPPAPPRPVHVGPRATAGSILVPALVAGAPLPGAQGLAEALREGPDPGSPYRSKPTVTEAAVRAVVVAALHVVTRITRITQSAPPRGLGLGEHEGDLGEGPHEGARESGDVRSAGEPSPWERLTSFLQKLVLRTRLARWLGEAHGRYLGELFEMFERGDLDAALRHAIPLGGASTGGGGLATRPRPRTELTIAPRTAAASGKLVATLDVYEELRRRYRAAVEVLEQRGRIDEAAFVLAELLHADEEAVAFLERHGRLREAAELAEGRRLAPGLVVRQWCLAGDAARAARIARRYGCFEDAVVRLERAGKPDAARSLRAAWGEALAAAGDFAGAVDAVWPEGSRAEATPEVRALATSWIELAIEAGGVAGARMLARKIAESIGDAAAVLASATALLGEPGPEGRALRARFGEGLAQAKGGRLAPCVARATARALFADGDDTERDLEPIVRSVIDVAGDAGLRADRPRLARRTLRLEPYRHVVARSDRGTRAVRAAVALPRRRTLVALGELGVAVLDARGRVVTRFERPADRLVISDQRTRAITLHGSRDALRLGRIDLVKGRSDAWSEIELADHADDFDGSAFVVTLPKGPGGCHEVVALDATIDGLEVLEQREVPGTPVALLGRSPSRCDVLAAGHDHFFAASFELPGWTARGRRKVSMPGRSVVAATPGGDPVIVGTAQHGMPPVLRIDGRDLPIGLRTDETPLAVRASGAFIAVLVVGPGELRVVVLAAPACLVRGEIVLEGATAGALRIADGLLTLCDDAGRVLVIDLMTGHILRDLRV